MTPRPRSPSPLSSLANLRLTPEERTSVEQAAYDLGFSGISAYFRHLHREALKERGVSRAGAPETTLPVRLAFGTKFGSAFQGDARTLLNTVLKPQSVDLVVTSPPFGLVRKKTYGNEDADAYVDWFRPFAEGIKRVLKPQGSLVIDIGGAWKKGFPVRSLYHFELLTTLCRDYGFFLAQEFYWWNPSKLPTPAEWVNVRRIRVKDAVNSVYWLSLSPWPKASNRRVLQPYSDSMRTLLKRGYRAKMRPSGHDISSKFAIDNGASIPPNLITIPNTESNSAYMKYCKAQGIKAHPARFPSALPEYFIRMLTDRDDCVVDPFGGSCVTGEVCERLERRWICIDLIKEYLEGARGRFTTPKKPKIANLMKKTMKDEDTFYRASRPDLLWHGIPSDRLAVDGGRDRPRSKKKN